jgi:hypothetical protein
MKKNMLAAAFAALAIASASADTIYVTGSTAFRSAANTALAGIANMQILAQDNATLTSAGNLVLTNTTGGYCVNVHWSGSEAGIQSILNTNAVFGYLDESGYTGSNNVVSSSKATNNHWAHISFSDTYQNSSVFSGAKAGDGFTYPIAKQDTVVGVVAFNWVASKGCPATNMTTAATKMLFANGYIPLAMLTGDTNHQQSICYLVGRNMDSGTRLTALAEPAWGVTVNVKQYGIGTGYTNTSTTAAGNFTGAYTTNGALITYVNAGVTNTNSTWSNDYAGATNAFYNYTNASGTYYNAGNSNVTLVVIAPPVTNSLFLWPAEGINGVGSKAYGNGGYASGGTLCSWMTNAYAIGGAMNIGSWSGSFPNGTLSFTNQAPNGTTYTGTNFLIGYAGTSDANSYTSGGLVKMTYNGFTSDVTNIVSGNYSFWSYEHVLKGTYTNANVNAFYTSLTNALLSSSISSPNVSYSAMKSKRTSDGGAITPKGY